MATEMSNKLTVREGLIEVISAERFQFIPRSSRNIHVVVMEKSGGTLRHYCTLRSPQDKLSIGEQLWGNYVCYVVDLSSRQLRIEQDFPTRDRITHAHVVANITYRAVDGERVAIRIDDALLTLRDELIALLRREIVRLSMEEITEERLEARLYLERATLRGWLGLAIERPRIQVDWDKEILERRKAALEQQRQQKAEEEQRRRDWQLQDEARYRERSLELEDIGHIDQLIQRLGLDGLPVDVRLRLSSMSREEALKQIINLIEGERTRAQQIMGRRMEQEYEILKKLIDDGVLESMDLVKFGQDLLDRYHHMLIVEGAVGMDPSLLFGAPQQARLADEKPAQVEAPDQSRDEANESAEESIEVTYNTPDDEET